MKLIKNDSPTINISNMKSNILSHKKLGASRNMVAKEMGFQLHQSHSLTVTGLKGGKKSKYWVSVGLLEISMWLSN